MARPGCNRNMHLRWRVPSQVLDGFFKCEGLDSKRRLTVPAALAPAKPGDYFKAEFDPEENAIVFRRISRTPNWLKVLKECPVSMDDLPPRSAESPKCLKL